MSDWVRYSVGELCDAGVAELQTGPFGTQLHAHDYVTSGIPVVPTEALRERRIDRSVLPEISPAKAEELKRHKLRKGDILFARRGVQATGHIGYVREAEEGFICGTGAIRLRVAEDNSKISPDFLSHVFANPASIQWFKFHAIGATMPNLNEGIIRAFTLSAPSVEEQKRISTLLNGLDDKIDLNRKMNATLEAMARAIFKNWFIDYGPTRAKAEGRASYLRPEIWALFPRALEGDRPAGWDDKPLSAVIDLIGGGTPKTSVAENWGGPIPWFSVVDAPNPSDVFVIKTEKSITRVGLESCSARILPLGTTIITARGTVGKLAMVGTEMAMNQSCYAVTGKSGWPKTFIYFLLKTTVQSLQAKTHGSVFDTITRQTFDAVSACCPTPNIAEAFERSVDSILERMKASLHEIETLIQIRNFLLPKLMSGQTRLRDAEKLVNQVA